MISKQLTCRLHSNRAAMFPILLFALLNGAAALANPLPPAGQERLLEWTFESQKAYADPFNDVEVDVIFERQGQRWRVPCFWRGGNRWTVRFAPPEPGQYSYHLDSTDKHNPDLNGHAGRVTVTPYLGTNELFKHGMLRVSSNGRYFEYADGTPFFWLADTWWTGLSDRLPWEGVKLIVNDRKEKGFTVVQLTGGLVPSNEETPPSDPGFCNEGGCVWEPDFKRINPAFFDYADRRIQFIVDHGLAVALVGGWRQVLAQMGVAKFKQHWRYLIARYGAYPVFWIVGGEVYDPPADIGRKYPGFERDGKLVWDLRAPGWTDVVRYVRQIDPYHHLVSVHEINPPWNHPLQDESLTHFDFLQGGDPNQNRHDIWSSRNDDSRYDEWTQLASTISEVQKRYARATGAKPIVMGELYYEQLNQCCYANYWRTLFWTTTLSGGAGISYGAAGIFESYSADKPLHRDGKYSFLDWRESIGLPGSYEVGLGARLLQRFPWWEFKPHPEWVDDAGEKDVGRDRPYAAGIPGKVRLIYIPFWYGQESNASALRVRGLEPGVAYHAFYWEPSLGMEVDLGVIQSGQSAVSGTATRELQRKLYDAKGQYRGELKGSGWDEYGRHPKIEGDAYQPEMPLTGGDWLLVLEAVKQ